MPVLHRRNWLVAMLIAFQAIVGIIGGLVFASTPRENIIFPGVFIRGVDVGGLSREQAEKRLQEKISQITAEDRLIIRYKQKTWELSYEKAGIQINIPRTIDKALRSGREGNVLGQAAAMFKTRYRKPELSLEYNIAQRKLEQALAASAAEVQTPVQNAVISVSGGKLTVVPEKTGVNFNLPQTIGRVYGALAAVRPETVDLAVTEIKPSTTTADLKEIKDTLGVGVTTFSRSEKQKAQAIASAVKAIDGRLIAPGGVFSFNMTVGPAVVENEYLHASLVGGNRLSQQSSGGVTQVASTLYQAALYSGLKIRERHSHLVPPEYAKLGQDAAVARNSLDLQFENNTGAPVYIHAVVKGSRILVNLLGVDTEGRTIQITTRETETKQPALTGPMGSHAKVYRIYYNKGVQTRREVVSEDDYI